MLRASAAFATFLSSTEATRSTEAAGMSWPGVPRDENDYERECHGHWDCEQDKDVPCPKGPLKCWKSEVKERGSYNKSQNRWRCPYCAAWTSDPSQVMCASQEDSDLRDEGAAQCSLDRGR